MDFIPKDDSDLTTKALCLAFWTFRNDWFRTIQSRSLFLARWRSSGLVNKSCVEEIWKWQIIIFDVPARVRRRNIHQSASRKNCLNREPLIIKYNICGSECLLRLPPSCSGSPNVQNNVNSYPFIWDASSIIPPYPQPT